MVKIETIELAWELEIEAECLRLKLNAPDLVGLSCVLN